MSNLWVWICNKIASDDAYLSVSTHLGDELASEPVFSALREFANSPIMPSAVPVLLLEAFNASQKRISRRRKIRVGSGALFGVAILIPSLAYAGVLPAPVSRIVQRVFNVVSLPIHIPSIATPSPSTTKSNSVESTPGSTNEAPDGEQSQTSNETQPPAPSDGSSSETNSNPSSEPDSILPIPGDTEQDRSGTGALGTSGGEIAGQLEVPTATPEVPEPVSPASPTPSESDPSAGD